MEGRDDAELSPMQHELQRCVDEEDLDRLLELVSLDEIAISWHRYTAAPGSEDAAHPDWWAVELFMTREIFRRNELYRDLMIKLVEHGTDQTLGVVGAGPLENYVSDDEDDLRWLEAQCATSSRFRGVLAGVWCAGDVTDATLTRLDAAAGEPLARPRPRSELPPEVIAFEDANRRLAELAGGMSSFGELEEPTAEQQAAAEAVLAAAMDLARRKGP
jgi:hypothetical protein